MSLLAVDIILKPPIEVMQSIVDFNNLIISDSPIQNNLKLNVLDRIPHITLRMGLIDHSRISSFIQSLKKLEAFVPENITLDSLQLIEIESGFFRHLLMVANNPCLNKYHKLIMDLPHFETSTVLKEHFSELPIKNSSTNYVQNFKLYAYENYSPHITLGKGAKKKLVEEISFQPITAVYQLGNHCSCTIDITNH